MLDHIIPRSRGGREPRTNLWPAHAECNRVRGDKPLPLAERAAAKNAEWASILPREVLADFKRAAAYWQAHPDELAARHAEIDARLGTEQ